MARKWRIAGINFDHFHMGDLLRMAANHEQAEIVGLCDETPARIETAAKELAVAPDRIFTDYRVCLERSRPELVILCPATAEHGQWTEKVAPFGTHILVEKPFASTLAEADRMIRAVETTGKQLAINWPLRWVATHVTAKRLVDEGAIGELIECHYHGGNRGPLYHAAGKVEVDRAAATVQKSRSWFYNRSRGGGSMQDYAGYGATLGTWYFDGKKPLEVTAVVDEPAGLEVDEHCIAVLRYSFGLSRIETRWGTFTDPWTHQTQPKCGFILIGREGTITSYDYEKTVRVQRHAHPEGRDVRADESPPGARNPIEYALSRLDRDEPVAGPLSPATSRIGQQIVDSMVLSAKEKRTVALIE